MGPSILAEILPALAKNPASLFPEKPGGFGFITFSFSWSEQSCSKADIPKVVPATWKTHAHMHKMHKYEHTHVYTL